MPGAALPGHPDTRLHELAYLELGRAPYASIGRISVAVPVENLRDIPDDPRYLEWRSRAILRRGHGPLHRSHGRSGLGSEVTTVVDQLVDQD